MIQKRYQHYTKDGVVWTSWFNYQEGDEELVKKLNRDPETKYQLRSSKLLNQFRLC